MINRTLHLLKRFCTMGPWQASKLLYARAVKKKFIAHWCNKQHQFTGLKQSVNTPLTVTILGFGPHTFATLDAIDWHTDFFIPSSPSDWRTSFFANVTIPTNIPTDLMQPRQADIKVPWELSRMHCLQKQPCEVFVSILARWMQHNPFPYGVNWLNPMEVAIRAINIITALQQHKNSLTPNETTAIMDLLAYHALFIEHCWEVSDRPNNHYLADLLGYLYLCCNLNIKKYYRNRHRAWQWFLDGLENQLLPDGTDYEGSTAYHRLVTEMVDLAITCADQHNLPITATLLEAQHRMHQFLADCTDHGGNLILIGDNDSGSILPPQEPCPPSSVPEITPIIYPYFGISILRTPRLHLAMRHATYQPQQPSGHFHDDALAITLSVDGIPFLIDPGTYLYTAHPAWRNQLRSGEAHNVLRPINALQHMPSGDLFQMSRATCSPQPVIDENETLSQTYEYNGVMMHRTCTIHNEKIIITDYAKAATTTNMKWHLECGIGVTVEEEDAHTWLLFYQQQPRLRMHSFMPLKQQTSVASRMYGVITNTAKLTGLTKAEQSNKMLQQLSATLLR